MTTPTVERRARWPWAVFVGFVVVAAVGCAFVVLDGEPLSQSIGYVVAFSMFGAVGTLIGSREPRNRIGWLLLWTAGVIALSFASQEVATYLALVRGVRDGAPLTITATFGNAGWIVGILPAVFLLPILFPTGRPHSPRWRWLPLTVLVTLGVVLCSVLFGTATFTSNFDVPIARNPLYVPALDAALSPILDNEVIFIVLVVVSAFAQVMRFKVSSGVERQQIKWFAFAISILAAYLVASSVLSFSGLWESIASATAFALLPSAIGLSVMQYRLWDLDVVVKKALVAGALVVLAIAVYAAAVALVGLMTADNQSTGTLFVVALLLGIAFRPVMRVGRRIADRIVYGRRATPYEVLTEFSERMGTSYATEDVLPRMAQVLGEGAGAEVARVWLRADRELRQASVWPVNAGTISNIDVRRDAVAGVPGETTVEERDRGELLGALSERKAAADPMNPAKEKLERDPAAQEGLVLRNVGLVEDLRASRQRLVAAQDEERRRLERNIHDGAQQQLVALAVKARLARQLTDRDPSKASELLGQIEAETQTALGDLRDLARGIYPPLLADRGLVAALEAQSRKASIEVAVESEGVGRYDEDVEATVYFCALEALQNVAKYAGTGRAILRLAQSNGSLTFAAIDQGAGFDPAAVPAGGGLQGMADRLAAVGVSLDVSSSAGAGTTVAGRVSLPV